MGSPELQQRFSRRQHPSPPAVLWAQEGKRPGQQSCSGGSESMEMPMSEPSQDPKVVADPTAPAEAHHQPGTAFTPDCSHPSQMLSPLLSHLNQHQLLPPQITSLSNIPPPHPQPMGRDGSQGQTSPCGPLAGARPREWAGHIGKGNCVRSYWQGELPAHGGESGPQAEEPGCRALAGGWQLAASGAGSRLWECARLSRGCGPHLLGWPHGDGADLWRSMGSLITPVTCQSHSKMLKTIS